MTPDERATKLLLECLDPDQRALFDKVGCFDVRGADGHIYRLGASRYGFSGDNGRFYQLDYEHSGYPTGAVAYQMTSWPVVSDTGDLAVPSDRLLALLLLLKNGVAFPRCGRAVFRTRDNLLYPDPSQYEMGGPRLERPPQLAYWRMVEGAR